MEFLQVASYSPNLFEGAHDLPWAAYVLTQARRTGMTSTGRPLQVGQQASDADGFRDLTDLSVSAPSGGLSISSKEMGREPFRRRYADDHRRWIRRPSGIALSRLLLGNPSSIAFTIPPMSSIRRM
jgi:hypothetical protein